MKNILLTLGFPLSRGPGAPPHGGADQPYRSNILQVQWASSRVLQLFLKNHYPLLQKIVESGACCR